MQSSAAAPAVVGQLNSVLSGAARRPLTADGGEHSQPFDVDMPPNQGRNERFMLPPDMPRSSTPGPRINASDAAEMKVRFNAQRHVEEAASLILRNTPAPRPRSVLSGPRPRKAKKAPLAATERKSGARVSSVPVHSAAAQPHDDAVPDMHGNHGHDDADTRSASSTQNGPGSSASSLEHRATLQSRRTQSAALLDAPVTLRSRDIAVVCRLAAVQSDHPVANGQTTLLRHSLPMTHIDLRWVYDPSLRPGHHVDSDIDAPFVDTTNNANRRDVRSPRVGSPPRAIKRSAIKQWQTIDDVTSDDAAQAVAKLYASATEAPSQRGKAGPRKAAAEGVVNSPRSAMAAVRRGVDIADLMPIDEGAVRKRLAIAGVDPVSVNERLAFMEADRQRQIEEVKVEYSRLCRVLHRDTVISFIDVFIDSGCDYARLPVIVSPSRNRSESSAENKYTVELPTDDRVTDALRAIREQTRKEQKMVKTRVESELQVRARLTDMREAKAAATLQATLRRKGTEDARAEQRKQETQLRALIADDRAEARAAARRANIDRLEAERQQRDAASAAAERAAEEVREKGRQVRMQRLQEKRTKREQRLADALASAARAEALREERAAASESYREELQHRKEEERKVRAVEQKKRAAALATRRDEISERGKVLAEEKRLAAEAKRREAEATLAEFERTMDIERQIKQLRDAKAALIREERADEADRRAEVEHEAREVAAEAHRQRFEAFKVSMDTRRETLAEQARQAKEGKQLFLKQHARRAEYERVLLEDSLKARLDAAETLQRSRDLVTLEATAARSRLGVERQDRLEAAVAASVVAERDAWFRHHSASRAATASGSSPKRPPQGKQPGANHAAAEQSIPAESPAPLQTPDEPELAVGSM